MKNPMPKTIIAALLSFATLSLQPATLHAQGTAFTYQGQLKDGFVPANGSYDLTFSLFGVSSGAGQVGSSLTNSATGVTNGLFTVTLDFGANFPGADRWLEIAVRTNGGGAFSTLTPRQPITAAPYAITAGNLIGTVSATGLSGTYSSAITLNNAANNFTGNGTGLTDVNAATLGGLSSSNFWKTTGNAGANPANGAFLGTTDNQPLEIRVNTTRALRLEPTFEDAIHSNIVNVVGGSRGNFVGAGVYGATIGGGGAVNYEGDPATNKVMFDFGTVSGGMDNTSSNFAATVGGGNSNTSSGENATVAGGRSNTSSGYISTVGGGEGNDSSGQHATVAGGSGNTSSGTFATVGGGLGNISSGLGATVPGGGGNTAGGDFSFAAGLDAHADHPSTFVWADSLGHDFNSTSSNQFLIRAAGGVGIGTPSPNAKLDVRGDIKLGSTGQFFAPGGEENLRILRGRISGSGGITTGTGFTVSKTGTGAYTVTFTTAFSNQPTVVATPQVALARSVTCTSVLAGSAQFRTWDSASAAIDQDFHFIAIGPR
jgi:hypothetical protein